MKRLWKRVRINIILLVVVSLFSTCLTAQSVSLVIKSSIYTAYTDTTFHVPLYVCYDLYKGGGSCSRTDMFFGYTLYGKGYKSFNVRKYYKKSGYDIGHMCNAEDFAYDCTKEIETFMLFNTLPQTACLNRGIWKSKEYEVRELSQKYYLRIICGGYNFNSKIGIIFVPEFCFKIIKNLDTGNISCFIFPNDNSNSIKEVSLDDLVSITHYHLKELL